MANVIKVDFRRPAQETEHSIALGRSRPASGWTKADYEDAIKYGKRMADNVNSGRVDLAGITRIKNRAEPVVRESERARIERLIPPELLRPAGSRTMRSVAQETAILDRLTGLVALLEARAAEGQA